MVQGLEHLQSVLTERLLRGARRALALLDKNPLSASYGCFDRKYWQYKIIDFPSGMQQELVMPLAWAWVTDVQGNPYFQNRRVEEYIRAAFRFFEQAQKADGSLDDYFPFERAFGATAYALAANAAAARITGMVSDNEVASFERAAQFLSTFKERGTLSNHHAIAVCALAEVAQLTRSEIWAIEAKRILTYLESVQQEEGWFPEYGGCDLGYQTVTVEFLARASILLDDPRPEKMAQRCTEFTKHFLHPDGSLGGEYGSRNTYNFYPGGFALLSPACPAASEVLRGYVSALDTLSENALEDDGVFGHMLSSWVVTVTAKKVLEKSPHDGAPLQPWLHSFDGAQLYCGGVGKLKIYGTNAKGGSLKIYREGRLIHSDTGFAGRLSNGRAFCQNKLSPTASTIEGLNVVVAGQLQYFSSKRLTMLKMAGLRLAGIIFGKFPAFSHFIRALMQRILIFGARNTGMKYCRRVQILPNAIKILDTIDVPDTIKISALFRSTDCVNMHVVTADSFQASNLHAWTKLSEPRGKSETYEASFESEI